MNPHVGRPRRRPNKTLAAQVLASYELRGCGEL